MLKKNSIPWAVKQISVMEENGKMNFQIAIQRKDNIWDKHRKSLLIHSLIMGFPIPPFFTKFDGEVYHFIDGKQRMTTILSYQNDEFPLSEKTPDIDGVEIAGLKCSELPEEFKKAFLNAKLTITRFENITDDEIEEMFFRLNNGVPLKSIESLRVLLGTENMKSVEEIAHHPFFKKTNISVNRYNDQEAVLQLLMITDNEDTGFSSKEVRTFVEQVRGSHLNEKLLEAVRSTIDFLDKSFDKKRKYLKKIHLPMLYQVVATAREKQITPEYFGLWADEFFKNLDKESAYSQASQSGSAKKENVQKRLTEIKKAFIESFTAYEQVSITN
jgi:DNA-binding transcriptional MerR regulator